MSKTHGAGGTGSDRQGMAFFEAECESVKRWIEYKVHNAGVPKADADDVVQECLLEALLAARHYDPARGSFTNFISRAVQGKIKRARAPQDHLALSDEDRKLWNTLKQAREELLHVLGAEPTLQQLAARSGLSLEAVERISGLQKVSLDHPLGGEDDGPVGADLLADPSPVEPTLECSSDDRADSLALVERCRAVLTDPLQRGIFDLRYARLLVDSDPYTMEHAAREVGILHIDDAWVIETLALDHLEAAGVFPPRAPDTARDLVTP